MTADKHGVQTGEDPTQAVLSESALRKKYLCDYVSNVATGCRHGCKFCYVPSTPSVRTRPDMLQERANVDDPQREWGQYVLYRDDLPERLDDHVDRKESWKRTPEGCGIVGVSFSTDCYMDGRAGDITRRVVEVLSDHQKHVRVLTRNPILALQDLPSFRNAGEYVTVGSSIPSLNADWVGAIEPRAPAPEHRLRGLCEFREAEVQTYVSVSPTYPTQDKSDLRRLLRRVADCDPSVVFHEPINPRGANFEMTVEAARDAGEHKLARELEKLRTRRNWVEYSLEQLQWMQELGGELDLPVHLWPDKDLMKHAPDRYGDWLSAWYERQSPEEFADRETPDSSMPRCPPLRSPIEG